MIEKITSEPRTLGVQFAVELQVENHVEGEYLDHATMAGAIHNAIQKMLEGAGYGGYTTKVSSVMYETDYPIANEE